jgi:hypothetical protein
MKEKDDAGSHEDNRRHNTIHNSTKKTIFVDVETIGITIVSISFIVFHDDSREVFVKFDQLIKPEQMTPDEKQQFEQRYIDASAFALNGMLIEEALIYIENACQRSSTFVSLSACADIFALTFNLSKFKYPIEHVVGIDLFDLFNFTKRFFFTTEEAPLTLDRLHKFVFGHGLKSNQSRLERLESVASIYFELKDMKVIK